MAHQMHIAFSDIFCGAGLLAGGPFLSSQGSLWGALAHGLHGMPPPNYLQLSHIARSLADMGSIAPLENLKSSRVWMFHGTQDTTVKRQVVDSLAAFYQQFVPAEAVSYVNDIEVTHAMPTDRFGTVPAAKAESPYIVNCGFDAAGALLSHIHGKLKPRASSLTGTLVEFDQTPFFNWHSPTSMDQVGYAYIPSAASKGKKCGIHVALHGCKQHRGAIGNTFATQTGYNEWAESNDFIVLYPQAAATTSFGIHNPVGSWDWWSYTGQDYALRSSRQMTTITSMVSRLAGT